MKKAIHPEYRKVVFRDASSDFILLTSSTVKTTETHVLDGVTYPSYLVDKKYKLFANISSGYRVPSLYQLYSEYGNKNLQPESSKSYEAGLQYLADKINGRVVYFKRDIKNVFAFYTDPVTFMSKYINADEHNTSPFGSHLRIYDGD